MIEQFGFRDDMGIYLDSGMYPTIKTDACRIGVDFKDKELVEDEIYIVEWAREGIFVRRFKGITSEYILLQTDNPECRLDPLISIELYPLEIIKTLGRIVWIDNSEEVPNDNVISIKSHGKRLRIISEKGGE